MIRQQETPPRAWGRRAQSHRWSSVLGNTPTSVGKTIPRPLALTATWKHPHERGEDLTRGLCFASYLETPPRAWGRLRDGIREAFQSGNTPTSVGKTGNGVRSRRDSRKHPHERGEDLNWLARNSNWLETPPRAWGRLRRCRSWAARDRNTPTSVGKTAVTRMCEMHPGKHPHERGEDRWAVVRGV